MTGQFMTGQFMTGQFLPLFKPWFRPSRQKYLSDINMSETVRNSVFETFSLKTLSHAILFNV